MEMKNCDILLFQSNYRGWFGWWGWIVSKITRSKWTHVALVLKDPTYVDSSYKGLYVLESGSEPWNNTWGVLVSPLDRVLDDSSHKCVALRRLLDVDIPNHQLEIVYRTVKGKKYDTNVLDLLGNELKSKWLANPRELDKFVCSSFVGYVYTALGLLKEDTPWFFMQPWHFSTENDKLGVKLSDEIYI